MESLCALVLLALVAFSAATDVQQCPGREIANLSDDVTLHPCKKIPCRMKKGTSVEVSIRFTPEHDLKQLTTHVTGELFGVPLPFVGVDGVSACDKLTTADGAPAPCPLTAGTTYLYKNTFPILSFYPEQQVKVHWALQDHKQRDVTCFEAQTKIVA